MRSTLRLLATVKPARYLEAGNPTGLTGLFTHPAPRSTLIYLYSRTLDKLKAFPDHSAYRTATEALTKHRLQIVESIKPAGYDEWSAAAAKQIQEHPDVFNTPEGGVDHDGGRNVKTVHDGRAFVTTQLPQELDEREVEWDGEPLRRDAGPGSTGEIKQLGKKRPGSETKTVEWVPEPKLEAGQIEEMETKIAGGLIEEVIQVAEGELKLVDMMVENKVWEELQDKAAEGQWDYFSRDQHTGETQAPPTK
ncbi:hypothetical protein MMC30_002142 [Trapelia coarctata]|nr:hypothetical protein [Trapelia coarctata]